MSIILGYVDPGTGATIMQLVLAGTVGIGAIVRLKWNSIRSLARRSVGPQVDLSGPNDREGELDDEGFRADSV
jgi:hypothetical protein